LQATGERSDPVPRDVLIERVMMMTILAVSSQMYRIGCDRMEAQFERMTVIVVAMVEMSRRIRQAGTNQK